ncbi:MAG: HD domain-containing protein [Defluviicoccus sp.]
MPPPKTQRIRDPIHDLIVFDEKDEIDQLAWRLINTPEFQRLRRIRQLGVSEFVFPGATHTRFAHSVGVYHNARRLVRLIDEHLLDSPKTDANPKKSPSEDRSIVIRLAALLHDIGHGPFSHAFEGARSALAKAKGQEKIKKHEFFSAELIRHEKSGVRKILSEFDPALPAKIAEVIEADDPTDIYHAVVSSSFDADRLDYLQRDRYMTGTRAGSVDLEWLMRNLIVEHISLGQEEDDPNPTLAPTFAFSEKARSAAEDFLLARYRLFTNVYLHKTTRGFEKVVGALIEWLGTPGNADKVGIEGDHPLIRFLTADGDGSVEDYARLDDMVLWGMIDRLGRSAEELPRALARCLLDRNRPKCLDLSRHFGTSLQMVEGTDGKIRSAFREQLGRKVFRDAASVNLYKDLDGVTAKEHKLIRVRTKDGLLEISRFTDTIINDHLKKDAKFVRYFFSDRDDFDRAYRIMTEGN